MSSIIIIRGGGELATAVAHRMHKAGYGVLLLERARPTALRRESSFSDAVYDGEKTVERVTCTCAESFKTALSLLGEGRVAMLVDPTGRYVRKFPPHILVSALPGDGDEARRRLPAAYSIGLGAGYCASQDVDCVIETMRGYSLGRIVYSGRSRSSPPPGEEATGTHVIKAEARGTVKSPRTIATIMKEGDLVAEVYDESGNISPVLAPVDGVLRGLLHDDCPVSPGTPIAEIDPGIAPENCCNISDKARCVSGSMLEAVMAFERGRE